MLKTIGVDSQPSLTSTVYDVEFATVAIIEEAVLIIVDPIDHVKVYGESPPDTPKTDKLTN